MTKFDLNLRALRYLLLAALMSGAAIVLLVRPLLRDNLGERPALVTAVVIGVLLVIVCLGIAGLYMYYSDVFTGAPAGMDASCCRKDVRNASVRPSKKAGPALSDTTPGRPASRSRD